MATVIHDLAPALELRARILTLLRRRPMDAIQLAHELGSPEEYPPARIVGALRVLDNAGHIERVRCRYQLVEAEEPNDAA